MVFELVAGAIDDVVDCSDVEMLGAAPPPGMGVPACSIRSGEHDPN